MTGEDGKADFLKCLSERPREIHLVVRIAAQERLEVEGRNLIILVELVGVALGKPIGMRLADLIVSLELTVERLYVAHGAVTGAVAASARCSRCPLTAERAITAAA